MRTASTFYATVPTPAQLNGDFSGGPQLYNPFVLTNGARTPYANNQIPASQISQMAKAAAKLYPTPNLAGSSLGNYFASLSIPQNTNQYNIRVDHQLTKKDNLYGRFSWTDDQSTGYNSPLAYNGSQGHYKGEQALLHETHIFSPNLLNDFAVGWTYGLFSTQLITADHDVATQDFGLTNLKIPSFEWGAPLLSITSVTALGSPINVPSGGYENNYQLDDDVTWTHGTHTVRAGIEVRQYRPALYNQATPNGNLSFDGRYTSLTATSAKVAGSPIADLIIGAPFSATATQLITSDGLIVLRWNQWQGYVQDDWKITPRLTLNMGMRYIYDVPFREVIACGNHVFAHRFFKRQSRRAAMFCKLKCGNPDVCVDNDDHPLDRTLRRRGFSARTSLMRRGTSASVYPLGLRPAAYSPNSSNIRRACCAEYVRKASRNNSLMVRLSRCASASALCASSGGKLIVYGLPDDLDRRDS